tara:strand:- start:273 stop:455 length:183 start_codon:yes stop_codon:yes gene_type:complete
MADWLFWMYIVGVILLWCGFSWMCFMHGGLWSGRSRRDIDPLIKGVDPIVDPIVDRVDEG